MPHLESGPEQVAATVGSLQSEQEVTKSSHPVSSHCDLLEYHVTQILYDLCVVDYERVKCCTGGLRLSVMYFSNQTNYIKISWKVSLNVILLKQHPDDKQAFPIMPWGLAVGWEHLQCLALKTAAALILICDYLCQCVSGWRRTQMTSMHCASIGRFFPGLHHLDGTSWVQPELIIKLFIVIYSFFFV